MSTGRNPAPYDYRNSTVQQDMATAKLVEERVATLQEEQSHRSGCQDGPPVSLPSDYINTNLQRDEVAAARIVQSTYRSHAQRRTARGWNLSASERWTDGLKQQELKKAGIEQGEGKNDSGAYLSSLRSSLDCVL